MKRWFKIYLSTAFIIYLLGKIWSIINGYRFFCDGWKSCDNEGLVIELELFMFRELNVIILVLVSSLIITFFVIKIIKESEK